ncbi:hypothetical protein SCLCIDRAFT_1221735 [Scleroderma citrinum Foug A]|uniref:Uncharacterized protein n=1 Tax=Scleroderma citrinum Foug A TaxID=1036808 RepID=A0A0C3D1L3_9AGAM|nr:hypothetical protein SCLCIDRAFT_1221735 [Scleroderma citrinum Foug A]
MSACRDSLPICVMDYLVLDFQTKGANLEEHRRMNGFSLVPTDLPILYVPLLSQWLAKIFNLNVAIRSPERMLHEPFIEQHLVGKIFFLSHVVHEVLF